MDEAMLARSMVPSLSPFSQVGARKKSATKTKKPDPALFPIREKNDNT
jgi:hypothetical protein